MLIDWFTVAAQAINFLVLVGLLRRFLYKPILKAIDAREERISRELADAATKQADAKKERDSYQKKNEEFDQQRAELLSKATNEADEEKQRLLGEARDAADVMSSKRLEALYNDAINLNEAITRRTQDEVFSIARKVLSDLAEVSLEEQATTVFIRQLRNMDGDAKSALGDALTSSVEPALVRSAFEMSDGQRADIQNAINETFSADVHLQFEMAPELVSGTELSVNGLKIAWSIDDYLAVLEKSVGEIIKAKVKSSPPPEEEAKAKTEPQPVAAMP